MSIADLALNALSGGIVGILGSGLKIVGGFIEHKQKMQELTVQNAQELALLEAQSKLRVVESEAEMSIARSAADSAIKSKSYEVFTDMSNIYKWAATAITLFRPAVTLALWGMTAWIAWEVVHSRGNTIINGRDLMSDIVNNVTFCASAATLWWFGDRPRTPNRST